MPTGLSSGADEPSSSTESPPSGRPHSRLPRRARYMVPWAAGLIVVGGSGAFLAFHNPPDAERPRAQTALCGLLSCAALRSAASASRAPADAPSSSPTPSPTSPTRAVTAVAPGPEPTPSPAPRPGPRPTPAPEPTPTGPWPWPDPTRTWPPPSWPPDPSSPPPDPDWPPGHRRHHDHWSPWS